MGSFRIRVEKRAQRRGRSDWPIVQLAVMITLIGVFVLTRLYSVYGIVTPVVCQHIEQLALGSPDSPIDGPLDMVFWIGLAGLVFLICCVGHGAVTTDRRHWSTITLWLINSALALGLIAYSSLYCAMYYPDRPGAATINANAPRLVNVSTAVIWNEDHRVPITDTWLSSSYGWTRLDETTFIHEGGERAEFKLVRSCPPLPGSPTKWRRDRDHSTWVFYDSDGRMAVHGGHFQVAPSFYPELQNALENPSTMSYREFVRKFSAAYIDQQAQADMEASIISYDEYQELVKSSWAKTDQNSE